MTLARARELLLIQAGFGSFYNGNSAKLILSEVQKEQGQTAVEQLIRECGLQEVFDFKTGTRFEKGLAITRYDEENSTATPHRPKH